MASETWRLLTTWDEDAAFHMGFDQAQLERGCPTPTLRLYTWLPDALSLGYFQRVRDVVHLDRATQVVRRMTGGGAIHHVNELTFSITVPVGQRFYRGPVEPSYTRIHAAFTRALAEVSVDARPRDAVQLASDTAGTGMCFHESTSVDLVWQGRKGVGSAQRRKAEGILHHGSIKLGPSPLETGVATVRDCGLELSPEAFAPILCRAFEAELDLRLAADTPTEPELEAARRLGPHFTSREMVERR